MRAYIVGAAGPNVSVTLSVPMNALCVVMARFPKTPHILKVKPAAYLVTKLVSDCVTPKSLSRGNVY